MSKGNTETSTPLKSNFFFMKVSLFHSLVCITAVLVGSAECSAAFDSDSERTPPLDSPYPGDHQDFTVQESLHDFIKAGDVDKLKDALSRGKNVNEKDEDGYTPLMLAVRLRQNEMIPLLLEAGADILEKDEMGCTALLHLLKNAWKWSDESSTVDFLSLVRLSGKSVVAERDADGETALMHAVANGLTECATALIELGANVNARDDNGRTVLMHAVWRDNEGGSVNYLLKAGAEFDAKDDKGYTTLMHAAMLGNKQVVQELLEAGADINAQDIHGHTALMHAVLKEHESVISELLAAGADARIQDNGKCTALMFAAYHGLGECAAELMERGADVNERDARGRTVLMYATNARNDKFGIEHLLNKGAEVNATDAGGHTALMYATAAGNEQRVQELLEAGADVDMKDSKGRTALMYACFSMHICGTEMLELLLQAGAEVNARDNAGHTPLTYAVRNADEAWVNRLLDAGADVNVQDTKGRTALMLAVQDKADLSAALLEAGAEVNVQDNDGRTALMYAVKQSRYFVEDAVNLLLDAGATVNVRDIYGRTALMYASWYLHEEDRQAIIDALLKAGANNRLKDGNGYTAAQPPPLMAALGNRDWDAVKTLVNNGVKFPDKDVTEIIQLMLQKTISWDNGIVESLLQSGKHIDAWSAARYLNEAFSYWFDGELPSFHEQHGSRIAVASFASLLRHSCYSDADIQGTLPYIEIDTTGICRYLSDREGLTLSIDIPGSEHLTGYWGVVTPSAGLDVDCLCAIIENDMDAVKRALQNGANANMRDSRNCSMLTWAALCGNVECVKLLLKHNLSAGMAISYPDCRDMETTPEIRSMLMAAATAQESVCCAPDSLAGKSLVMDYTDAQFCGKESIGKAESEKVWVPLAKAASLSGFGTSPKATRHLFPLNDDDKGTYNYSKTSGRTGHLSVKPENGETFPVRYYELTFTSPTGGTAVETQYRRYYSARYGFVGYKTYCHTRRIHFRVENE